MGPRRAALRRLPAVVAGALLLAGLSPSGAPGVPAHQDRSALAHAAWQVAKALALESIDDVPANPACQASLGWLNLDAETLRLHLVEIDSVWRLWLALISRHS